MVKIACLAVCGLLVSAAFVRAETFTHQFNGGRIEVSYPVFDPPEQAEAVEEFRQAIAVPSVQYAILKIDNRKGSEPLRIVEMYGVDEQGTQTRLDDLMEVLLFKWQAQGASAVDPRERLEFRKKWNDKLGPAKAWLESQQTAMPGAVTTYVFVMTDDQNLAGVNKIFAMTTALGRVELAGSQ